MSLDETYVATRRQLRGGAESLIAGPQYRAVRPLEAAHDVDELASQITEFFQPGRREL